MPSGQYVYPIFNPIYGLNSRNKYNVNKEVIIRLLKIFQFWDTVSSHRGNHCQYNAMSHNLGQKYCTQNGTKQKN